MGLQNSGTGQVLPGPASAITSLRPGLGPRSEPLQAVCAGMHPGPRPVSPGHLRQVPSIPVARNCLSLLELSGRSHEEARSQSLPKEGGQQLPLAEVKTDWGGGVGRGGKRGAQMPEWPLSFRRAANHLVQHPQMFPPGAAKGF